jgi:RimJ/RimL family protein N-acetyltransferase
MDFKEKRGIGYCGLACVLCSYDQDCPGCVAKIARGGDCSAGKCAVGKGVDGCYACPEYPSQQPAMRTTNPCGENMLQGKRNKAFNRFMQEFGRKALIGRLRVNYDNGITYHTPDKSPGDYDLLETEDEIYRLLRYGRNDPYLKCPEFETEHFYLRQVREDDAEELFDAFYGDLSGWMFYGNDMCRSIFTGRYATLDEMKNCIRSWLTEYTNRYYIRFTVIDKQTRKVIGTIEIFDNIYSEKKWKIEAVKNGFVLHIDFAVPYETREYLSELLCLADNEFFRLFGFNYLLIRAVPEAEERIMALLSSGYEPFDWERGREHYYMKRSFEYGA